MTEDYKLCEYCGEEIEQGRSDKRFCDKRCYNHYKNHEYRNSSHRFVFIGDAIINSEGDTRASEISTDIVF